MISPETVLQTVVERQSVEMTIAADSVVLEKHAGCPTAGASNKFVVRGISCAPSTVMTRPDLQDQRGEQRRRTRSEP